VTGSGGAPDLVVVGAGTMGAWTALHAQRAGLRTTLIDAYGVAHSRATSGDESRIIRSSHGSDAFYSRWSREARELWIGLEAEAGESIFVQCGAAWFAHRDRVFEDESVETLRSLGVPVEKLSPDDARARWPGLRTDDLAFVVHEPEAGLLRARTGVQAVVRTLVHDRGVLERGRVRPGVVAGRRMLDVIAEDGSRLAAEAFVFACGPWHRTLFPDLLGDLISVTKQDVLFFGPGPGDDRWEAERFPCWVDYDLAYYGIPGLDGRGVKCAPDAYGPPFDPDTGDRLVDPETIRRAREYLGVRMPDLAGRPIIESRVCQYEATPDTHFVIDRHPDFDNVWLVGGGSGHGFKHGPVIGRHVVSRLLGAPAGPDDERFSIARPRELGMGLRSGADTLAKATHQ
jgi:glycine/D-amino acid oxidase-like deaminating enzyme